MGVGVAPPTPTRAQGFQLSKLEDARGLSTHRTARGHRCQASQMWDAEDSVRRLALDLFRNQRTKSLLSGLADMGVLPPPRPPSLSHDYDAHLSRR